MTPVSLPTISSLLWEPAFEALKIPILDQSSQYRSFWKQHPTRAREKWFLVRTFSHQLINLTAPVLPITPDILQEQMLLICRALYWLTANANPKCSNAAASHLKAFHWQTASWLLVERRRVTGSTQFPLVSLALNAIIYQKCFNKTRQQSSFGDSRSVGNMSGSSLFTLKKWWNKEEPQLAVRWRAAGDRLHNSNFSVTNSFFLINDISFKPISIGFKALIQCILAFFQW